MYTTQEEMRGEKERVVLRCEMASRAELCREAPSPAAEGGRAGTKSVYVYMLIFSSFFCASLQTQKWKIILCISLCIHKKEKSVYVKLYTLNLTNVMRAYVYIRILKKCSGWFRYTDFRKFCTGLFAYFSLREAAALRAKCICLYVQKRKQNVYVYIHKKRTKCICLRIQSLKRYA